MKFIIEFFNRFGLKTPSFFQTIQWISIVCGTVAGIPALLAQFQNDLHINLPQWVTAISNWTVAACAAVAWVIAKLPVKQPVTHNDRQLLEEKLPFTEKKNDTSTK